MGRFVEVISDTTGGAERRTRMPLDTFANELTEQGLPSSTDLNAKLDIDFASQLTPADNDRVNANTVFAGVVDAVARVVLGTCTGAGTSLSVITLGGASGIVGDQISTGGTAAEFATNITDFFKAFGNPLLIPVASADDIVDNLDGTFTITCIPGANALVFSTDDPALSFSDVTEGADEGTFGVSAGQVNGCRRYVALLTQTGSNAPVPTVLINELGEDPTYSYNDHGLFFATTVGAVFTLGKTAVSIANPLCSDVPVFNLASVGIDGDNPTTKIHIRSGTQAANQSVLADDVLYATRFEIEVYF